MISFKTITVAACGLVWVSPCLMEAQGFPAPIGIIVKAPTPATGIAGAITPPGGSMNLVATFVAVANFADQSQLTATTVGTGQVLFSGDIAAPGIFNPRAKVHAPWTYPLTIGSDTSPASIPGGSQVSVTLTDPFGNRYSVQTASFISGVVQSSDAATITISGAFDPTQATTIYLGFWPFPFQAGHVTVTATQITIDLSRDLIGGFPAAIYPITVMNGTKCDSAVLSFRSVGQE